MQAAIAGIAVSYTHLDVYKRQVIYYVEDEPKENDEATAPATWVADVDDDFRYRRYILKTNLYNYRI